MKREHGINLFTNDRLDCLNIETNQAIPKIQMIIKDFEREYL